MRNKKEISDLLNEIEQVEKAIFRKVEKEEEKLLKKRGYQFSYMRDGWQYEKRFTYTRRKKA